MYASASNGGVQGVPRDALPEPMTSPEEIVFKPRQECAGYRQHEPNDAKVPVPLSEQSVETVSPEAGAGVGSPAVSEAPANVTSDILDRALKENRKATGVVLLAEAERYAEKKMTEFKLIGPQLQGVKRESLIELQKLVSEKEVEFQTILDEDMSKMAVTRDELSGMPDDFVDGLEDAEDGKKGLTHKWPDFLPAMQQCTQEATCETLHTPRARQREEANTPLLEDTLRLRCEIAEILGYKTHADYQLEVRMSKNAAAVYEMYDKLVPRLTPPAQVPPKRPPTEPYQRALLKSPTKDPTKEPY